MPPVKEPNHIFEPNSLACGQAVIAMLTGVSVEKVIELSGTDRETDLKCMKRVLTELGVETETVRHQAETKEDLPEIALLSLETPRCWHWSLYFKGTFFDPEHGVLSDFPESARKYYWKIKEHI